MNEEYIKNSHCSYCGTKFTEQKLWPRKCFRCYNDSYKNPIPVVVCLLPVTGWYEWGGQRRGLLIQQRNIEPKKGEWALTGGYVDDRETWQEAAVREVKEELGITMFEDNFQLYDIVSSTTKNNMLIFCVSDYHILADAMHKIVLSSEVAAVDVMWEPQELAFPAHTQMANEFLERLKQKG